MASRRRVVIIITAALIGVIVVLLMRSDAVDEPSAGEQYLDRLDIKTRNPQPAGRNLAPGAY